MDLKTLEIVEPTPEQVKAEPGRYRFIPEDEVEAVEAMSYAERQAWVKRDNARRELANRNERRKRKRLRKAGRAARKRMRAAQKRAT